MLSFGRTSNLEAFFIFIPPMGPRGSRGNDPVIENSGLAGLIKKTFKDLVLPSGISGCAKVQQRNTNPDVFDLVFFSNTDSGNYRSGRIYSTWPELSTFERMDFENFADTGHTSQKRLAEFIRRLAAGELKLVTA
jgi:hypothetical protein